MVIDLRGRGRRWAAGLLLLSGLWLAACGGRQVVREVAAVVSPGPAPIRRVARTERVVALTVDAVWGAAEGEALIAALLQAKLPATFFVSGRWLAGREEMVRRLVQAGFEFGNATESYPYLDALSPESQAEEVRRADGRLTRLLGRRPVFFRPPHGESTPVAEEVARELGYRTVLWSIDPLDGRNPPPELLVDLVERQLTPGAIVRLTTAGQTAAQAVPLLAALLKERGYRAVTLSELLLADNYYVDRETGEQRPLPGSRAGERPVLTDWWRRSRQGTKKGVTLAGEPMEGLLPAEVRRKVERLARRIDRPAQAAHWDAARQEVRPEVIGQRVDVEATVRAVLQAEPGTDVEPVVRPERPQIVREMFSPVYRGRADGKQAALMFNVAWGNEVLPELLQVLRTARVKATFFVEGRWAERYPDLVRQIAAGGHCVGSHAFYHLDYRRRSREELLESLA
ncbi:MAG TPA: polysaccharide deacetylase family protein, partial [Firmicutes bacterium]|nr:polysaccharide deacetylase family protein [Bacillota bacterium]